MASTLEKIQANEKKIQQLATTNIEVSRRIMAMDQAQLSMSKTLAAVSEVLIEKGVISDQDVLDKLRDAEDKSSEQQINQLVSAGVLAEGSAIDQDSIVVLQQEKDERIMANYYVVEMRSQLTAQSLRDLLLNQEAGHSFEWQIDESSTVNCTIKKVLQNQSVSKGE